MSGFVAMGYGRAMVPESLLTTPGASNAGAGISTAGTVMMGVGALTSAIGAYYGAQLAKLQAKSGALNAEFEASMSALNARNAERDAQSILEAGQREQALRGLLSAQEKADILVSSASRGVQAGAGNAAEIRASAELAKQLDMIAINANSVRAANERRTQAVGFLNQSSMASTNARNLRASGRSISPSLLAATSLLGGAGNILAARR